MMTDGLFHNDKSILSEHYGFTKGLLNEVVEVECPVCNNGKLEGCIPVFSDKRQCWHCSGTGKVSEVKDEN